MPLSPSAQKMQDFLTAKGYPHIVVEHNQSTRTSAEAAEAIGCTVAQIAKSLVFVTRRTKQPLMIIASGSNRVDTKLVGESVGEPLDRADPDFVRQSTGYAIGGVPPMGHTRPLKILIDEDLMQFKTIWAAAGAPSAVFELTPDDLVKMTGGNVLKVKVE